MGVRIPPTPFPYFSFRVIGMKGKIEVASKVLIARNGRILVADQVFNGKSVLDIPGGRIEYGETPEQCAIREVKEETGLDIMITDYGGWTMFFRDDLTQVVCFVFMAEATGELDISSNPDSAETMTNFRWLAPEEFLNLDSDRPYIMKLKEIVKKRFHSDA